MNDRIRVSLIAAAIVFFIASEFLLVGWVDRPVALYLHHLDGSNHALIDLFRDYTDAGLGKWYAWPSGLGLILCLLVRLGSHHGYWKRRAERYAGSCGFFFVSTSGAGLVTDMLKPLFGQGRPKLLFEEEFYGFHPFTFAHDMNAFPSGHTTTAFAVATALTILYPRGRPLFFLYACLIALSRLMVAAHYGADILAGAVIGVLFTLATRKLFLKQGWLSLSHTGQASIQKVDRNNPTS